jgi:hypothetical protein
MVDRQEFVHLAQVGRILEIGLAGEDFRDERADAEHRAREDAESA